MKERENITEVKVADLITEGLQIRVEMQEESVENYAAIYRENPTALPPVTVFHDSVLDKYYLADGFHRVAAAKLNESETIDAEVSEGTFEDALRFAIQANAKNGIRRTKADAIHAMELVWSKWDTLYKNIDRTTEDGLPSVRQLMSLTGATYYLSSNFINSRRVIDSITPPQGDAGEGENAQCQGASGSENSADATSTTQAHPTNHDHTEERNATTRELLAKGKDRYGMDIPERLLPAFTSREPKEMIKGLGVYHKQLEKAKEDQNIAFAQSAGFAMRDLDATIRALRFGIAHCVCRMCRGRGCGACSDLGFQTRLQYERNPPEFKYDAEKRLYARATSVAPEMPVGAPVAPEAPATPVAPKEKVPDAEVQFDTLKDVSDLLRADDKFFN